MAEGGRERTIVGGSASLFGSRLAVGFLSYLATAAVARVLSNEAWGGFTFVTSLTALIGLVFDFQLSRLVLVEILRGQTDEGRTVGSYMTLRLLAGGAAYGAVVAFVIVGDYPDQILQASLVGGLALLVTPTWNGLFVFFQSRHWLRSVGLVNVLSRVILLGCVLVLIAAGARSLLPYMWPVVVADGFVLVTLALIASRHVRLRPALEWRRWSAWAREAVPITLGFAIGGLYYRVDTVMLSQLDTLEAVGLYGIGYKFSDLIGYLPIAVLAPVFTLLVRAWPDDPEAFRRTVHGAWVLLLTAAFGLASALALFAHPLIVLLYGGRYGPASNAARLVIIGQGLRFFTSLCVTILISVSRNKLYALAALAGLALNVALNIVLIPRYSFGGAAFATIVTELVVLAVLMEGVRRVPGMAAFPWATAGRVVLATGALATTALGTWLVLPWPVAGALAAVAYVGTLHLLGVDGPGGLRVLPHLLQPASANRELT